MNANYTDQSEKETFIVITINKYEEQKTHCKLISQFKIENKNYAGLKNSYHYHFLICFSEKKKNKKNKKKNPRELFYYSNCVRRR